jgi:phospholipase C
MADRKCLTLEQGGWADHVVPVVAPKGTQGEWLKDPYNQFGDVPLGPGKRPSWLT